MRCCGIGERMYEGLVRVYGFVLCGWVGWSGKEKFICGLFDYGCFFVLISFLRNFCVFFEVDGRKD